MLHLRVAYQCCAFLSDGLTCCGNLHIKFDSKQVKCSSAQALGMSIKHTLLVLNHCLATPRETMYCKVMVMHES